MAYGLRYQIAYYRKSGGRTSIDILEKDYSSTVSNLLASGNPLEITREGNINNIYEPSSGSGATIRVMAIPLSLQHLFTTDPQKYIVKIYDGGSENSSGAIGLVWQGFINTGIYTESYSTPISLKSEIVIECNDGVVLLEDILYTQTVGGVNYTGFSTIGQVMQNIFAKLGIDFLKIRTATDIKFETYTNLFTALSVNNENYYDEKGVAMSCRQVLESIFGGLGLVMFLNGFIIYIIDPIHLHLSNSTSKQYNTHPTYGGGEAVIGFGGYLDISSNQIDWAQTGQRMDIVQLFNYIDIKYDPYNLIERGYNFNEDVYVNGIRIGNALNTGTYGEFTNNGVTYRVHIDITMKDWTLTGINYFEGFEEITPVVKEVDYVIRQIPGATGTFVYTFPFSNIQQDENVMLELSIDVYVNTKHVSNIFDPAEAGTSISSLSLKNLQVKIGDKWYSNAGSAPGSFGLWYDTSHPAYLYVRELDAKIYDAYYIHGTWFRKRKYYVAEDTSEISDKWTTAILYIPLKEIYASGVPLVNGSISITIPKALDATVVTGLTNVLIKNINLQVVNLKKDGITNDGILTNGKVNSALMMKKSTFSIDLKNGIGPYGVSKGAFSSNVATIAGLNITGLSRADDVVHKTNKLLLQSLLGQYGSQRFKLTGYLNVKDYLTTISLYLIKDTNYMGTKAFYIVSNTYYDREETMDVTMLELTNVREA